MSGIIGHITYAVLGHKAAEARELPVVPIIRQHYASYLAGCYLGSDIMTLPGGICTACGEELGYASPPAKCPNDNAPLRPYVLNCNSVDYTPQDIHRMFYGRTHLLFGWKDKERPKYALVWDELPEFLASVVADAIKLFGPGERQLAYVLGWITHVVGDAMIKSVQQGLTLHLLNGTYTHQNRPIQDLFSFHEVGRKELGLNWQELMFKLVETPVEPVQVHFMRLTPPRGELAQHFPEAWEPDQEGLIKVVMAENRRYQRIRNGRLLKQLALTDGQCHPELSKTTGGLTYTQMVEMAGKANFRHALWQIAEAIADLFQKVAHQSFLGSQ